MMDGCAHCFGGTAEEACENIPRLTLVEKLLDESHFDVSIVECRCGLRFLKVFCEQIDWVNGNDPQQIVVTVISAEEQPSLHGLDEAGVERALSQLSPRRCLESWFPSDGPKSIGWKSFLSLMRHD